MHSVCLSVSMALLCALTQLVPANAAQQNQQNMQENTSVHIILYSVVKLKYNLKHWDTRAFCCEKNNVLYSPVVGCPFISFVPAEKLIPTVRHWTQICQ
ncbi:hypothetical protein XELAEV_18026094mg [Xenopus laevis]|uniref:Secreted protein n=1 Tax=Xenopus laevis TaxID=8355 RepID=A0A974CT96_XENLA|nr:hypothetical protein XELAEV_18026094mg [Xenopus laevis]